jgi:hypothetical protein
MSVIRRTAWNGEAAGMMILDVVAPASGAPGLTTPAGGTPLPRSGPDAVIAGLLAREAHRTGAARAVRCGGPHV